MDRHQLWRRIRSQYEQLEETAPEGFEPLVEVFLVGRQEPIAPAFVETSRSADYPWVVLQAQVPRDESDDARHPDEYWVHVHESLVGRVEVRYVRKGQTPIGFAHHEVDEQPETPWTARKAS